MVAGSDRKQIEHRGFSSVHNRPLEPFAHPYYCAPFLPMGNWLWTSTGLTKHIVGSLGAPIASWRLLRSYRRGHTNATSRAASFTVAF